MVIYCIATTIIFAATDLNTGTVLAFTMLGCCLHHCLGANTTPVLQLYLRSPTISLIYYLHHYQQSYQQSQKWQQP